MSHNFRHNDTQFIYNPDRSGNTLIRLARPDSDKHELLRVPTEDILAFAANIVRGQKIERLEQMSDMQVLMES